MAEKLKMYKTTAGAQQYGSKEDWDKLSARLFRKFLKDPSLKDLQADSAARAGAAAAFSKEFKDEFKSKTFNSADASEQFWTRARIKEKAKSLLKAEIKKGQK